MAENEQGEASLKVALSLSFLIVISVLLLIVVFSWMVQEADATTIGISLSRSCEISTSCPTYLELEKYDSSNQYFSGFFNYSKNGFYERQPSPFKHHWEIYKYTPLKFLIVDPHGAEIPHLSKHITLVPSSFKFFLIEDMTIGDQYEEIEKTRQKQICAQKESPLCWETITWTEKIKLVPTRTERNDMWIYDNCTRAMVTPDALNDAVSQFLVNCNQPKIAEKYFTTIVMPQIPFEWKDSRWSIHAEYMRNAIEYCKTRC